MRYRGKGSAAIRRALRRYHWKFGGKNWSERQTSRRRRLRWMLLAAAVLLAAALAR